MLTFIRLTAPSSSGISGGTCQPDTIEADMADELEDPDAAAARLEAALERIARLTAIQSAPNTAPTCRIRTYRSPRSPNASTR